jgi:hypothetical protein
MALHWRNPAVEQPLFDYELMTLEHQIAEPKHHRRVAFALMKNQSEYQPDLRLQGSPAT